ncbi:MAG: PepSY domain-containing protein [Actinobacteria bacterium]|nr:PepSY domain-containing protein [Actinomycetota bacterium]
MADAITTVVTATPDAVLVEADLDSRRGDVVWEIDTTVGNNRERTLVDAVTGSVI